MPAAPTPPLTGSSESAPGKPSTETSITPFTFSSQSQKNVSSSTVAFRSHIKASSKSSHLTNSVAQKNSAKGGSVNSGMNFPRTSPSTGKENNNDLKGDSKGPSLQSKLSIPVPPNQELDGCKNSRARCEELNEFIKCTLCNGYLIDATTITECVHSFCKTCIVKYLNEHKDKSPECPKCHIIIHKAKPFEFIRSDPTLQDIVYKIVPGLYKDEMDRRKSVYRDNTEAAKAITSGEEKGEYSGERTIYSSDDIIPLSIEYLPEIISYSYPPLKASAFKSTVSTPASVTPMKGPITPPTNPAIVACQTAKISSSVPDGSPNVKKQKTEPYIDGQKRYLRCIAAVTIRHLKKLIRNKYDLKYHHDVEMFYKHDLLLDEFSILDLAYIYSWKRNGPLALYYKISDLRKTDFPNRNKTSSPDLGQPMDISNDSRNKSSVSVSTSPIPRSASPAPIKSPSLAPASSKSTPPVPIRMSPAPQAASPSGSVANVNKAKQPNVRASLPAKSTTRQVHNLPAPIQRKHSNENNSASGNSRNSGGPSESTSTGKSSGLVSTHTLPPNSSPSLANTNSQPTSSRNRGSKSKRQPNICDYVNNSVANGTPPSNESPNNSIISHHPQLLPKPHQLVSTSTSSPVGQISGGFYYPYNGLTPFTFANGLSLSPSITAGNRQQFGQIIQGQFIPHLIPQLSNSSFMPVVCNPPAETTTSVVQASNATPSEPTEPSVIPDSASPAHITRVSSPATSSPSLAMCSPNNSNSDSPPNTSPPSVSSTTAVTTCASSSLTPSIAGHSLSNTASGVIASTSAGLSIATTVASSADTPLRSAASPSSALAIAQQILPQSTTVTAIKDSSSSSSSACSSSAANKASKLPITPKRIDGVIEKLREKDKSHGSPNSLAVSCATTDCNELDTVCKSGNANKSTSSVTNNSTALATVAPITASTTIAKIASITPSTDRTTASTASRILPSSINVSTNNNNTINRSPHIPITPAFDKKPIGSHTLPIHSKHSSSNTPLASVKPMPSSNTTVVPLPQAGSEVTNDRAKESTEESPQFNSPLISNKHVPLSSIDEVTSVKTPSTIEAGLKDIIAQVGKLHSDSAPQNDSSPLSKLN